MDDTQPLPSAVAVLDDRLVAVGDEPDALALADADTRVIELGEGETLLPGFIDSHQHRIGDRDRAGYGQPKPVIDAAIRQGWTSINEMFVTQRRLQELEVLDTTDELRLRVNAYLALASPEGDSYGDWYEDYEPHYEYSRFLRLGGVKITLDHGWGLGQLLFSQAQLDTMVMDAHGLGWQIATHTVGKPAHTAILDALEGAIGDEEAERFRHRIEHVIVISDADVERMKRLGIIASIQLNGPTTWVDYPDFESGVSPELYPDFARWRDLIEAGLHVAGSGDWPWGTLEPDFGSPMQLLYQGVTRTGTNRRLPEEWMRGQELTIEEALRSLTIEGAYATFEEDVKGSLAAGKYADLVLLEHDPVAADIESVPDIRILATVIGGRAEFCAVGNERLCPDP
jgi:predicted amidohydrolase YtcJ